MKIPDEIVEKLTLIKKTSEEVEQYVRLCSRRPRYGQGYKVSVKEYASLGANWKE